jgi:hypothetical protein
LTCPRPVAARLGDSGERDDEPYIALTTHDAGIGAERILAAIELVLGEVRGLRAELAGRVPEAPVSRVDRHLFAALAPEISLAVGAAEWTVRELLDHARARDPELLAALDGAIGLDDGAGRRLGKFLARTAGFTIDDFRVERVADERAGTLWRVVRVSSPQTHEGDGNGRVDVLQCEATQRRPPDATR